MIASPVEDFENGSISTMDSVISATTMTLVKALCNEASPQEVVERVFYYRSALNCINSFFLANKMPTLHFKEFITLTTWKYKTPEFHTGILINKVFSFANDKFDLEDRKDTSK